MSEAQFEFSRRCGDVKRLQAELKEAQDHADEERDRLYELAPERLRKVMQEVHVLDAFPNLEKTFVRVLFGKGFPFANVDEALNECTELKAVWLGSVSVSWEKHLNLDALKLWLEPADLVRTPLPF